MRGSVFQKSNGKWAIRLDLDPVYDPETGGYKRRQTQITVGKRRRDAETKLDEILHALRKNEYVEPSKLTFGEWLGEWLETAIKPPNRRERTYDTYKSDIKNHIRPKLGGCRLQQLKATEIKRYYNESSLSSATLERHHTIISGALKAAQVSDLVHRNVATLVVGKPHATSSTEDVLANCWTKAEANTFLAAASEWGIQPAAFYALALDTGARKMELCGLKWTDLNWDRGMLSIVRQLSKPGAPPRFGPIKNGLPGTVKLASSTLALLKKHKARQNEIKLANRAAYHDYGLIFAKDWERVKRHQDTLGDPLQANNIGEREFAKIIEKAGVKRITFHGLRHTCATLLLAAGEPVKVVQERLRHKKIETTLNRYAHVLPDMQEKAAATMETILF